jgi:hypothetical protein
MSSRYKYDAGAAGTVTVPAGCVVAAIFCHAASAGTMVVTPVGQSALPSVPIPAGATFQDVLTPSEEELITGSTLVFTGTDAYYVRYKIGA